MKIITMLENTKFNVALGGRDHSTILYGSEKIAKETANNETTKSTIDILIKKRYMKIITMLENTKFNVQCM